MLEGLVGCFSYLELFMKTDNLRAVHVVASAILTLQLPALVRSMATTLSPIFTSPDVREKFPPHSFPHASSMFRMSLSTCAWVCSRHFYCNSSSTSSTVKPAISEMSSAEKPLAFGTHGPAMPWDAPTSDTDFEDRASIRCTD